ncbi:MAG: ferrous iron transporter B, partial [Oscillospiraceae bacterium]
GKTTLFNALTGSNQYVGNWPGVTVEKKEGKLKGEKDIIITDLPGIYSLSPYTLEEVVARNYLIGERPEAILNVIDGTNIERNLYLTTQLIEIGIPVVVAINMMDIVAKNGDIIDIEKLGKALGCEVCEISALKGTGINEAAEKAIALARSGKPVVPRHRFSGAAEHALAHIEEAFLHDIPEDQQRWYAIKIFERDEKVLEILKIPEKKREHIENDIKSAEAELDDDSESIITNERYCYITDVLKGCYTKKNKGGLTTSDKIDRVVTNRILALPIFAVIMFLVYFISVTTVGTWVTDWMNDGLFGEGFHLFGMTGEYEEELSRYAAENVFTEELAQTVSAAAATDVVGAKDILDAIESADFDAFTQSYSSYGEALAAEGYDISAAVDAALSSDALPSPESYGVWVPGIPVLIENALVSVGCAEWLQSLILDGIVAGVGGVLGFVPQIFVLFLMLGFLESCGYMSRIAFVLDKIFRKFGLSGKSFIPMLIGVGCGVPGVMASRTIENERDRRMTIMTTTFIPCGAKMPVIALIAGALFKNAWWVAPSAFFVGCGAVIVSGIMLKKTKMFAGEPAPFVMELPAYHLPTASAVLRSMWERGWSFIKKAGTVILLSTIIIWGGTVFGKLPDGSFGICLGSEDGFVSILNMIGSALCWLFAPIGFGQPAAAVATIMGLLAKEEIVAVLGITDFMSMSRLAGYSFLVFNLLCAPCFAAIAAIRREMNSAKWTAFALIYQSLFAYAVSLIIYQFGLLFSGSVNVIGLIFAILVLGFICYQLLKPYTESTKLSRALDTQQ